MISARQVSALRGEFELNVFRRGRLVSSEKSENLIVTAAAHILAQLLAGQAGVYGVTKIGFGISGTPADPADNALVGAYVKAIAGYNYPQTGRVRFSWTLESAEANGTQIREFGLLTAGDSLVARKVRPANAFIEKAVDLSLSGTWTVIF